jgi:CheY-like chemotaxis protein
MPTPSRRKPAQDAAPAPRHYITIYPSNYARLDWSWPTVLSVAVVIGFILTSESGRGRLSSTLNTLRGELAPEALFQTPEVRHVLVVTSNPKKQQNVIATLRPRGLEPLLARSLDDFNTILTRNRAQISLVVLDEEVRGTAGMARRLRKSLPPNHVIMLKASCRPEDIGPLLLDAL